MVAGTSTVDNESTHYPLPLTRRIMSCEIIVKIADSVLNKSKAMFFFFNQK